MKQCRVLFNTGQNMTKTKKKAEKLPIATFELTDKKGAISFHGFVTVDIVAKSLFLINMVKFGSRSPLSMSFSAIELRTLANTLIRFQYDTSIKYKKNSGGTSKLNELSFTCIEEYTRFTMLSNAIREEVSILTCDMESLGEEIKLLIEDTQKNCYLMQRSQAKTKRKDKNKV